MSPFWMMYFMANPIPPNTPPRYGGDITRRFFA